MQFKVTKQFEGGNEQPCAQFKELTDAQLFVSKKVAADAAMNIKVIYRILTKYDEPVSEHDTRNPEIQSESGQSTTQSARSAPTPFATAPRPPGTMPKWMTGDDEKKK